MAALKVVGMDILPYGDPGFPDVIVLRQISFFILEAAETWSIMMFANSHFPRPAGPHFPASQGHIKRPVLEISRAERVPPC